MQKTRIGVGVIGFGFMGRAHTYGYRTLEHYYENSELDVTLAGVCSRTEEGARRAAERFGFSYSTTDFRRLIADPAINVLHICTPNHLHKEAVLAALEAGKHIYCDKPLAVSHAEALEILAAQKQAPGSVCQMALQYRFFPATLRAKQLVQEGRLGRILAFRGSYLHSGAIDPLRPVGWRQDPKNGGGGVLFDMGVHILDMMIHLMGGVKDVYCKQQTIYSHRPDREGKPVPVTVDDASYMVLSIENGACGMVEASKIATGTNDELRFELHGDQGAVRFNLMEPNFLDFYDNTASDTPLGGCKGFTRIECVGRYDGFPFPGPKYTVGWIRAHVECLHQFLRSIQGGNPAPSPSFSEAAYLQYVMERAGQSAREGRVISL